MSRLFVESFFPQSMHLLRTTRYASSVYTWTLFPEQVAAWCPEVTWELFLLGATTRNTDTMDTTDVQQSSRPILLRNPVLSVWAANGLGVGLYGGYRLLVLGQKLQQQQQQLQQPSSSSSSLFFFAGAFFLFALMNATALPLHCFYEAASHNPSQYPILWSMDCLATGISSFCIMIGWYFRIHESIILLSKAKSSSLPEKQQTKLLLESVLLRLPQISPGALVVCLTLTAAVVMGNALFFGLSNNNNNARTLPLELWYLLPTIAAGVVTTFSVILETCIISWGKSILPRNNNKSTKLNAEKTSKMEFWNVLRYLAQQQSSVWFLILGAVLVTVGVLADAAFCQWNHQNRWYGDALMAATLTFAGCDMAFVGLYMWVSKTLHNSGDTFKTKKQG